MRGLKSNGLYPTSDPSSVRRSNKDLFSAIRSIQLSPLCREFTNKARHRREVYDTDEVFNHLGEELRDSLSSIEDRLQGIEFR